jgi:hypothetical protein
MSPLGWLLLGWYVMPFWLASRALVIMLWLLWQLLKYAVLAAVWAAGFIREKINARSTSPSV